MIVKDQRDKYQTPKTGERDGRGKDLNACLPLTLRVVPTRGMRTLRNIFWKTGINNPIFLDITRY